MMGPKKIGLSAAFAMLLAACETYPSVGPMAPAAPALVTCPAYTTGAGPITFRFPETCDGMVQTASGLRIIPLTSGDRNQGQPQADSTVVVNYEGFLASNGARIDSSYARGESSVLDVQKLIPGWGEVLQLMRPDDEWVVYIPAELAYGSEAVNDLIPANSDLIFRLQLEGFLDADALAQATAPAPEQASARQSTGPDMPAWQANFPWNPEADGVTLLESGVAYVQLEAGPTDQPTAGLNDDVVVHYEGRLAETSVFFDSSWSRGQPATFPVGALIPGFTEALTYMRPGDRFLVHIPADQAYGANGSGEDIPPNADLMFQINLLDILPTE